MHQFSQRVLDYQDARLNPLCEAEPCPTCKAREARRRFEESVRDAAAHEVGDENAAELLSPSNVYLDSVRSMADWIEDTVAEQVRHDGGKECANCTWNPDDY